MVTAEKSRIDCRHIDVLDGIRAVSVIIVSIFGSKHGFFP